MKIYWLHAPNSPCLDDGDFAKHFNNFSESEKNDFEKPVDSWVEFLIRTDSNFVTLNPLILNFLEDEVAKKHLFVKTKSGFKAIGDVKEVLFKFNVLGAGEICCDTDFSTLE